MSYNKASAEKQWRAWKEAEEKQLRVLGVEEDTVQRLRAYDWEEFKRERRRQEWIDKGMPGIVSACPNLHMEVPVGNVESLLDSIENPELFDILKSTDKQTLEILLMKMDGFSSMDISKKIGLTVNAINLRIHKIKKKVKKLL